MQLISKAIVDGSLESLSEQLTPQSIVRTLRDERGEPNTEGNRQQRRAAAAIARADAKRMRKVAACAR
jgi:hypothetical protein